MARPVEGCSGPPDDDGPKSSPPTAAAVKVNPRRKRVRTNSPPPPPVPSSRTAAPVASTETIESTVAGQNSDLRRRRRRSVPAGDGGDGDDETSSPPQKRGRFDPNVVRSSDEAVDCVVDGSASASVGSHFTGAASAHEQRDLPPSTSITVVGISHVNGGNGVPPMTPARAAAIGGVRPLVARWEKRAAPQCQMKAEGDGDAIVRGNSASLVVPALAMTGTAKKDEGQSGKRMTPQCGSKANSENGVSTTRHNCSSLDSVAHVEGTARAAENGGVSMRSSPEDVSMEEEGQAGGVAGMEANTFLNGVAAGATPAAASDGEPSSSSSLPGLDNTEGTEPLDIPDDRAAELPLPQPIPRDRQKSCDRAYLFCTFPIFMSIATFVLICTLLGPASVLIVRSHDRIHELGALNALRELERDEARKRLEDEHERGQSYLDRLDIAHMEVETRRISEDKTLAALSMAKRRIVELESTERLMSAELEELLERVVSLQSTKEDTSQALDMAWDRIDQLMNEKHLASKDMLIMARNVAQLEEMKWSLSDDLEDAEVRIISLEATEEDLAAELSKAQANATNILLEREAVSSQLRSANSRIDDVELRLGLSAEELQAAKVRISSLEDADRENRLIIGDLNQLNKAAMAEVHALKDELDRQFAEAVSAVDAVATVAANEKAEQMRVMSAEIEARVEALMLGAVEAVNAVADSANSRRLTEIAEKDRELEGAVEGAVKAITAVAEAGNRRREEEVSALRAFLDGGIIQGAIGMAEGFTALASRQFFWGGAWGNGNDAIDMHVPPDSSSA